MYVDSVNRLPGDTSAFQNCVCVFVCMSLYAVVVRSQTTLPAHETQISDFSTFKSINDFCPSPGRNSFVTSDIMWSCCEWTLTWRSHDSVNVPCLQFLLIFRPWRHELNSLEIRELSLIRAVWERVLRKTDGKFGLLYVYVYVPRLSLGVRKIWVGRKLRKGLFITPYQDIQALEDAYNRTIQTADGSYCAIRRQLDAHKMACSSKPERKGLHATWKLDLHAPTIDKGTFTNLSPVPSSQQCLHEWTGGFQQRWLKSGACTCTRRANQTTTTTKQRNKPPPPQKKKKKKKKPHKKQQQQKNKQTNKTKQKKKKTNKQQQQQQPLTPAHQSRLFRSSWRKCQFAVRQSPKSVQTRRTPCCASSATKQ